MSNNVFVQSFSHLKDRPKADRALQMLQKIASLVKPIMRKQGWVLPLLTEFFPDSANLVGLNVNGGEQILLRLRPAWAPDTFYDEERVVSVMLHELTHNVHGPHDNEFYKYLSGLEDEYDALKRSGYSGEGFFSTGHRLGTNVSHNLTQYAARKRALYAAERRRQMGSTMGGGGRVGGRNLSHRGMTPGELAAQAAERRARDETSCGSGVHAGANAQQEAAKAAKDSVKNDVVDLTRDSDEEVIITSQIVSNAGGSRLTGPSTSRNLSSSQQSGPSHRRNTDAPPKSTLGFGSEWPCPECTYINTPLALQCGVCLSNRPPDLAAGWTCLACGESGMSHQYWTCPFCGTVKAESIIG